MNKHQLFLFWGKNVLISLRNVCGGNTPFRSLGKFNMKIINVPQWLFVVRTPAVFETYNLTVIWNIGRKEASVVQLVTLQQHWAWETHFSACHTHPLHVFSKSLKRCHWFQNLAKSNFCLRDTPLDSRVLHKADTIWQCVNTYLKKRERESTVFVEKALKGKRVDGKDKIHTHTHTPYAECVANWGRLKTKQLPTRQRVDIIVSIAHMQTSVAATKPPRLYSELDVSLCTLWICINE